MTSLWSFNFLEVWTESIKKSKRHQHKINKFDYTVILSKSIKDLEA